MLVLLILFLWFLIGIISSCLFTFFCVRKEQGYLTIGDFKLGLLFSLIGPVATLVFLGISIDLFLDKYKDRKFFEK